MGDDGRLQGPSDVRGFARRQGTTMLDGLARHLTAQPASRPGTDDFRAPSGGRSCGSNASTGQCPYTMNALPDSFLQSEQWQRPTCTGSPRTL
jgi:hypothetical protein